MVPKDLIGYFTTSSAVAGTLIGLLFVSISLRYDAIFGTAASFHNRAVAAAAFTALVNALSISLWALIPRVDLGYPAVVLAAFCVVSTLRLHVRKRGPRDRYSFVLVAASVLVYLSQFVNGVFLIAEPHEPTAMMTLTYTLFAAFATALFRSWQLLQPDTSDDVGGGVAVAPQAASPPRPPA
jgi:hypothetical protein